MLLSSMKKGVSRLAGAAPDPRNASSKMQNSSSSYNLSTADRRASSSALLAGQALQSNTTGTLKAAAASEVVRRRISLSPLLTKSFQRPSVGGGKSGGPVFVFWAGVEGTGHHLIDQLGKNHPHVRTDHEAVQMTCLLWNEQGQNGLFNVRWHGSPRTASSAIAEIVRRSRRRQQSPSFYFLSGLDHSSSCSTGMLSYPNYAGPSERTPDVAKLVKAMRRSEANFKVVVLIRDALSIICSCSIKRNFRPWNEQAQRLRAAALDLVAQLRHLDASEYICLDYNGIAGGSSVETLDNFLYDGGAPDTSIGKKMKQIFNKPRYQPAATCSDYQCDHAFGRQRYQISEGECMSASELHDAMEVLRQACPNHIPEDMVSFPSTA